MQRRVQVAVAKGKETSRSLAAAIGTAFAAFALALICAVIVGAGSARAAVYTENVTFAQTDLGFSKVGGYDLISVAGARWLGEPGKPRLPLVAIRVGLPAGSRVLGMSIAQLDSVDLPGTFFIAPATRPEPLAAEASAAPAHLDPAVYGSDNPYPSEPAVLAGAGRLGGETIAEVMLRPLRYRPTSGRVTFYTTIQFRLEYVVEDVGGMLPATEETRSLASRLVTGEARPWRYTRRLIADRVPIGGSDINYLIITSEVLQDAFEPLRQWKMRKGLAAEIATVETITLSYPGRDLQEKIRNAIRYYRGNCGTDWVLLGGDVEIIPDRKMYTGLSDKPNVPCDLYYSDLDGDWNADGDLYWGEIPADNVDMYADVFLGRAPVSTVAEAETFVEKALTYEGFHALPTDYLTRMVFMGEILWGDPDDPGSPDYTDAGVAKNLIDDRYVPGDFSIQKLYQSRGNLCYANAISALDQGVGFANVLCHGHYKSITVVDAYLGNGDFAMLTSEGRYGLMYSASCLGGGFDQNDCVGEAWVTSPRGGGFYIGNSRYGWDNPGEPGQGPSDLYDQSFFESVFSTGFLNAGKAHADAKHEFVGESRIDGYMLYIMYGLNLLGDPETSLWTEVPSEIAAVHATAIDTTGQIFPVTVTKDGLPLAGAKVCLWKPGEVFSVGETAVDGSVSLQVDALTAGTLYVTVTGPNLLPYKGEVGVATIPPHPAMPQNLAASEGAGPSVNLAWSAVDDEDLVSYRIYRSTAPEPVAFAMVAAPETAFADTAVAEGATYYYWVAACDEGGREGAMSGSVSLSVTGCVGVPDLAEDGAGLSAIPNPFVTSVTLSVNLPDGPQMDVRVFDVRGRCVAQPALTETATGRKEARWNGLDFSGARCSPGIYFVVVTRDREILRQKLVLLE